ncbi:MAG TPA: DUF4142 domain-containing protein [Ramlibacter sp.]|uniref:DUF4142 domain-containing protein n=1 Tax=Ramlibacter sp. TaxID=1917967 RepID=UPI002D4FEF63|nr:DUF4142 domain-containing protein [Ramlibacter sp.]HZY17961.1 DUF4142 domain-containing protein [Ramlibacter sp.]
MEVEAEIGAVHPSPPDPAAKPTAKAASAPRRALGTGFAAEAARNVTRLPPEERQARAFLRTAAVTARFEVEASRLAVARAQSAGVREFAAEQLQYHQAADAEILHLLHGRAMAPPMMENAQRKALARLARMSGPKFDREFMELVGARRQREEVQMYQQALLGVRDPVLKGWIERQLPTLREQQAAVQRIAGDGRRARPEGWRPAALPGAGSRG